MQTPYDPPQRGEAPLCQMCQHASVAIIAYHPKSKRKIGLCKGCAKEDERLEKRYRPGDR